MVNQADEPLTKVTLNLYTSDLEWFKQRFDNYSDAIRNVIRRHRTMKESDERFLHERD